MIVHCSAGIGRTGVLILMDTALALMELREPVYPLDIVRIMRDQRACMVQNVVSHINMNINKYNARFDRIDRIFGHKLQCTFWRKFRSAKNLMPQTRSKCGG